MSTALNTYHQDRWVRASDGLIAGICEGLGKRFGIEPWLLRIVWLVSILAFGTGLLLYVIMAMTLPREDRLIEAQRRRVLGVCARLSRASGWDVGAVRALTVFLGLASFGVTVICYVVLYFVLPDEQDLLVS